MRRRGPRPLMLHLLGASIGAPNPQAGLPPVPDSGVADPALVAGIAAYRRHPWRRTLPDPPAIWTEGPTRLLDYGAATTATLPVLFVPSLINRAYILDLMPHHSMMRWLAAQGTRPLLLDWGWPGAPERRFTLAAYIARLHRAIEAVGQPVVLAGYCMGGLLATAAALQAPIHAPISALALLATPWDFHATPTRLPAMLPTVEPLLALTETLPIDAIQTLFALAEPGAVAAKYRAFAAWDQFTPKAERFVALEDWLNDGVPLAAPVARETLAGWYGANTPARGAWSVDGHIVEPARLRLPCFAAIPAQDRIVPPASALALATRIQGAAIHRPDAGHIGMAAGPRAETALWQPLLAWLRTL